MITVGSTGAKFIFTFKNQIFNKYTYTYSLKYGNTTESNMRSKTTHTHAHCRPLTAGDHYHVVNGINDLICEMYIL